MIAIKTMKYLEIKLRIVQDFHEGNFRIPLSYTEEDKEMKRLNILKQQIFLY